MTRYDALRCAHHVGPCICALASALASCPNLSLLFPRAVQCTLASCGIHTRFWPLTEYCGLIRRNIRRIPFPVASPLQGYRLACFKGVSHVSKCNYTPDFFPATLYLLPNQLFFCLLRRLLLTHRFVRS